MTEGVGKFLASWQQLSIDDRKKGVALFAKQPETKATSKKSEVRSACPSTVYSGIQLSSYFSRLYYYPTMHWTLDRTPDDDSYWVGIFKSDAKDSNYITYEYIKKTAQGSYKIGKLNTTSGMISVNRSEKFELRIFKGKQRLKAETNILQGVINIAPTDPFASDAYSLLADIESEQPDLETLQFIRALESLPMTSEFEGQFSLKDSRKQWENFTLHQQQLLFPILEQGCLPDEVTKAGPQNREWPEPNVRFADVEFKDNSDVGPDKIVLTIMLDHSYTYIYPQVFVKKEIPKSRAWMGMYYPQSDTWFGPDSYIDNNWAWVGTRYGGTTTNLNIVKEYAKGPTNQHYLGVIFDDKVPLGFAAFTIEAAVSATPALPPATFEPVFNVDEALRYAQLSALAYKPYSEVQTQLSHFNLTAVMQIFDSSTDTNGFIASNDASVVVAFRGTNSFTNMLTDVKFIRKRIDSDGETFGHKGFVVALDSVFASIEARLVSIVGKKALFITGHSLGGALATLAGYRISRKHVDAQSTHYVYGCPPVGDINLANSFREMDSNTITIQNDPVSSGKLVSLGEWAGLYKPFQVMYLPKAASHGIADYIKQLKALNK